MISNIGVVIFLTVIFVSFHHGICDEDLLRISMDRVPSQFSAQANCTSTTDNLTICDGISSNFGQVSVIKSSATETLINYVDICIGTPCQYFLVDFDTSSSDLWIPSSQCFYGCDGFHEYNSSKSTTYVANGSPFSISYGDGSGVEGFFSIDTVTVSGIAVKNQTFAEATYLQGMSGNEFDGILGLAYPDLTSGGENPFFYNMWSQGLISKAIFSFYLNPDENATTGGELIFGGIDSRKYSGSITYIRVAIEGYWEFQMKSVKVGSITVSSSTYAIVATGTTLITGPTTKVKALNRALGGKYDSAIGLYTVDCLTRSLSSFPNVTFTIGSTAFVLTPLQYLLIVGNSSNGYTCYSVFYPSDQQDSNGNDFWILGDYFLFRYYSIFDIQKNRVGFAKSISYNWIQSVDPSLFPKTSTTTKKRTTTTTKRTTTTTTTTKRTTTTTKKH